MNGTSYEVLEPILELLLKHGNEIETNYRWGSNPTGYFCILKYPINFVLIKSNMKIPNEILLNEKFGEIDYKLGTAVIRSSHL